MCRYDIIGSREPKIDGIDKAAGLAKFVDDITLPGMLWGAILRSPYPHAKIVSIDTDAVMKIPGVEVIITAADTPLIKYIHMGSPRDDKLPLQDKKVRYIGDEVAAVAAINKETALQALKHIVVKYEVLPSVFDPEEAMNDSDVLIHDDKANNIAAKINWVYGDIDKGFMQSDYIFEDRFVTPAQSHCILEPHGTIASYNNNQLTIWTTTQSPYFIQKELAHLLELKLNDVRIMEVHVAGAFGARSKVCEDEAIAAYLSKKSNRPVKIILTREEEMCTTRVRHPYIIYLKSGFSNNGKIMARELKAIIDNGAYNHYGPAIMGFSGMVTSSLYQVENVKYEGNLIYTNKQYGGPYRGFGSPQVTFAIESHMDQAARKLGIDPIDIRLLNCNQTGDVTANGWEIKSCGMKECIEAVKEKIKWEEPKKKGVGKGIACSIHAGGGSRTFPDGDFSSAIIHLTDSGKAFLFTGVTDNGTYITTVLCQIVSEILKIPMNDIQCISMDTATTPTDFGSWASKTAFLAGNAVIIAANDVKQKLLQAAANILGKDIKELCVRNSNIHVNNDNEVYITFKEAIQKSNSKIGRMLVGSGHYESPTALLDKKTGYANISAAYSFAAHAVELNVDENTGKIELNRFVAAHDVGHVLNLNAVEGQIEGAVAQGIGFALYEEQIYQDGQVLTKHLRDHRPVTFMDIPPVDIIIIETDDPEGPFGAKGVAEIGTVSVAAAIASAVYDATGVTTYKLPIKPEDLYISLNKADKE